MNNCAAACGQPIFITYFFFSAPVTGGCVCRAYAFHHLTILEKKQDLHSEQRSSCSKRPKYRMTCGYFSFAEGVGFEPTDLLQSTVFKTVAIDQLCHPSYFFINYYYFFLLFQLHYTNESKLM